MDADEALRVRLGAGRHTAAEAMEELARDESVTVRAALALNPAASPQANALLARDKDERVRVLLARKLGALAPTLSPQAHDQLRARVIDMLGELVADEAVRVRAAVAEEIHSMPDAPRELILHLAQDPSLMVCEPVLLFSPLLSSTDLVKLITTPPCTGSVAAIARRSSVDPEVSDAIAATTDAEAIRALLANPCAQIREATLDALATRSASHSEWHEPLVKRPALTPGAARELARLVAGQLLEALAARADLDPTVTQDLQKRLTARLSRPAEVCKDRTREAALMQALSLAGTGKLTELTVLEAARTGDVNLCAAFLAVAGGVPLSTVERAGELRHAKGLVSLIWKAGFSMKAGVALQMLLTRLSPDEVLQPAAGDGFPLTEEEMRWQIDFLGSKWR
jgi:uncharacterized protein (DUF2336 family)